MPVSSALIILLFVTSIFSVISVHLFGYDDLVNFGNIIDEITFSNFTSIASDMKYS